MALVAQDLRVSAAAGAEGGPRNGLDVFFRGIYSVAVHAKDRLPKPGVAVKRLRAVVYPSMGSG